MRKWSLSEFLNLMELRSQYWCVVELCEKSGFSVPHSDTVIFYTVLSGEIVINDSAANQFTLSSGDAVIIMSGEAHAVRTQQGINISYLDYLQEGAPIDTPISVEIGEGEVVSKILCGKLIVRWPFGERPKVLPSVYVMDAKNSVFEFDNIVHCMWKPGGASVLTRVATLLATVAFQNTDSEQVFIEFVSNNPVDLAKQYIEKHPFKDWTVGLLARRLGMGRSTFAARFTCEVGITPIEYVTIARMKLAERLLKSTDLKISDISQRVGYKSEAAFSRRFTAHFGVSPGKARKDMKVGQM